LLALCWREWERALVRAVLPLDALGSTVFAFLGARAAGQAGLGVIGMTTLALLTSVGGGVIADAVCGATPRAFRQGSCVGPPIVSGIAYWALDASGTRPGLCAGLLAAVLGLSVAVTCRTGSGASGRSTARTPWTARPGWAAAAPAASEAADSVLSGATAAYRERDRPPAVLTT